MSHPAIEPKKLADLRSRAASRLTGATGAKGASVDATDALAVLHALASSPATAADALALLHELQVLQVELDLQAEELRESRAELESALRRQIELYDLQPVGCFSVDRALVLRELNRAGAAMLGVGRDEAYGLSLDSFLSASGGRTLRGLIPGLAQGLAPTTSSLQLVPRDGPPREVRAHIGADPADQGLLIVLTPADEDPPPPCATS